MKKILAILALPAIYVLGGAPCIFASGSDSGWCGIGMLWTLPLAFGFLVLDVWYLIKLFKLDSVKISSRISVPILTIIAIALFVYLFPYILSLFK